ncbi:MAG: hypothetical protein H3C43_07780 [Leptonema sp. (in: Bacteria)]|nr:hypothetical protein [Leptonema sp. (in: bacteria)]
MYILGFILIFAGLALMLYYFVLRFAGHNHQEPIVRSQVEISNSVIPQPSIQPTQNTQTEIEPQLAEFHHLYSAGYLYIDSSHHSRILLDQPEKIEAEITANMRRLGPATISFRNNGYYFDYGDGHLLLPEKKIKEIRFSDGGVVFVPKSSELPLVYFFTVETQALREFLSYRP